MFPSTISTKMVAKFKKIYENILFSGVMVYIFLIWIPIIFWAEKKEKAWWENILPTKNKTNFHRNKFPKIHYRNLYFYFY